MAVPVRRDENTRHATHIGTQSVMIGPNVLRLILFIVLIGLPIAEIALFIVVGGVIGAIPTILLIVLTALLGSALLKRQGGAALQALKRDMDAGEVQASSIGETMTIALAGLLLLTPGFITDAAGIALFIPAVRRWLWSHMSGVIKVQTVGGQGFGRTGRTINLDEDEYAAHNPRDDQPRQGRQIPPGRPDPSSPWNAQG